MTATWRFVVGTLLAVAMAGCNRSPSAEELKVIKDMTGTMRTQCVGRYLIDLPESFVWGEFPEVVFYYGLDADFKEVSVQIVDAHSSPDKFNSRVAVRINAIAGSKNLDANGSMLLEKRDLGAQRILVERYKSTEVKRARTYEVHVLLGSNHVLLKANSFPEDTRSARDVVVKLASQIRAIEGSLDRQGSGFCLGPVLIDADNDHEVLVNHHASDRKHPDVTFDIYMSAVTPDEGERLTDQIEREQVAFDVKPKILRKGQTMLGPMEADEVLMRFNDAGLVMHSFGAWSRRSAPSLTQPTINLSLSTGGEISSSPAPDLLKYGEDGQLPDGPSPSTVSSSLTDDEAIGLWDAVVKSVRLRPNSVRHGK